jgi:hypothetical protein
MKGGGESAIHFRAKLIEAVELFDIDIFYIDLLAAIGLMPDVNVYVRIYTQQVQHIEKLRHLLVHRTNKNIHRR